MDFSKLSRNTQLGREAIERALDFEKGRLKDFKPPETKPRFEATKPLTFINRILWNTCKENTIKQSYVIPQLCGPKGAADLLANVSITDKKSTDLFETKVAKQARTIKTESDLATINAEMLEKYIKDTPQPTMLIDWLRLLCAAILLHAHQTAYDDAVIERTTTPHTRKQPVTSQEPSKVKTPNITEPTATAPETLPPQKPPRRLPQPELDRHQTKHKTEITLLADITSAEYSNLAKMAKTIQELNPRCQTHLDLETLLLNKYPQLPHYTTQHIYSAFMATEKDEETGKRKLEPSNHGHIRLDTTLSYYFDHTRNKPTEVEQERISERLIGLMDEGKHAFIILPEDQDSIERFEIQDQILNQIDDILFPPGYVVPTPPPSEKPEGQPSIWESELKRLVDEVKSLPTNLTYAVPSPYEPALKELKSKTHPVHASLRKSIKEDILDVENHVLQGSSTPNINDTIKAEPYNNPKLKKLLQQIIDHIAKIEHTTANTLNDWLENTYKLNAWIEYLKKNPISKDTHSKLREKIKSLSKNLGIWSTSAMRDTIALSLPNVIKYKIKFEAPNDTVKDFYRKLEEFWTAIVESATRTLYPKDTEPLPDTLI